MRFRYRVDFAVASSSRVDSMPTNFAKHWIRVGEKLKTVRLKELQSFDYARNVAAIDALLDLACRHAPPRASSGLVQLQRYLAKGGR